MKIGYPCINRSIGCTANSTFRLASYSEARLIETAHNNLDCLEKILEYNAKNGFGFFRLSSDIIPFASHPVCSVNWQRVLKTRFREVGAFMKRHTMRLSMHPDQFTLLNSPDEGVYDRSLKELEYHRQVLDSLELDSTAKIQIHVGGVYGNKQDALDRFASRHDDLPLPLKRRLVIENDDRLYSLAECLDLSRKTGIPVVFDTLHHECLNSGETLREALASSKSTWKSRDGLLMADYSSQQKGAKKGKHSESIDPKKFQAFLQHTNDLDFDIMLEIKDKEVSAQKALSILKIWKKGRN